MQQKRDIRTAYTVIDGIPTINPVNVLTKKPLALSEAQLQQAFADFAVLRDAYWAGKKQDRSYEK